MRSIKVLISVLAFAIALNPIAARAQLGGTKLTPNAVKFNEKIFASEVKQLFDGNVMGYQIVLMKDGQILSELAGGKARNIIDGEAPMTINTPANIGSTAKFFGGTALLKEFQKVSRLGGGINSWLAEPIYEYFPKVWRDGMHPSIKQITFKDLLQHKSGFIQSDKDATVLFDYLAKGVSSDQSQPFAYGKSRYANANITMVGYLLPFVHNMALLKAMNTLIVSKGYKADDIEIQTRMGNNFEEYIRGNIFNATTPKINPSCDSITEYPAKNIIFAYSYDSPNSIAKGKSYSPKLDVTKACHAAGGWYITGHELAAYAANALNSENIISAETRKLMFDDDTPKDRLLWSFTVNDSSLAKNFNWNSTPYMGGDHIGAHGTIILLPDGYSAVGIVNSNIRPANKVGQDGGSGLLTLNIVRAFNAAVADSF